MLEDLMERWDEVLPTMLFPADVIPPPMRSMFSQTVKEYYGVDKSSEASLIKVG